MRVFRKGNHFCEFYEKDAHFQKGDVISANSTKKDVRFPKVQFVDFRKIATAPRENQKIDSGVVQKDQPPLVITPNLGIAGHRHRHNVLTLSIEKSSRHWDSQTNKPLLMGWE